MSSETDRPTLRGIARWLGAGIASGFISGFLIGGVGGRLAMFILRVTSDPALQGTKTDDGFIVGRFSGDTGFLIGFCAFGGAAGGIVYVLLRGLLPERHRAALFGLLAGLVGGSVIVHPDGIDFKILSPLWLAIAMFVILPGFYGAATSKMTESLGARTESRVTPWLAILAVPALVMTTGIGSQMSLGAVAIVVLGGLALTSTRVPSIGRIAASPPAIWLGRLAIAAIAAWSTFLLARDTALIL